LLAVFKPPANGSFAFMQSSPIYSWLPSKIFRYPYQPGAGD
jgi:hypothetical protein